MGLADGKVALILEVCISQKKNRVKYWKSVSRPKKRGWRLNTRGLYLSQKKILKVCISEKNKGGGGKCGGLYLSQLSYLNNNNKIIQD